MKKPKDPKTVEQKKTAGPAPEDDSAENAPEAVTKPETATEPEAEPEVPGTETEPEAPDALPQFDAPDDEALHDDHPQDEEHGHRSLAATALMVLVGIIVVASLTLWAAPKLAPQLPEGVAQYLRPGQMDTEGRFATLGGELAAGAAKSDAEIAALNDELTALSSRLDTTESRQASASQTEAALAAAQSAAQSLAARLDAAETELISLRDEFTAISNALADAGTGEGTAPPEIAAAVAALGARLDNLAASIEGGTAALSARIDAVESRAADARDIQSEALGKASSALQQARLQAAVDVLASRLTGGLPYGAKLDETAAMAGAEAPEALAIGADSGLATAAALEASFGRHAQAAVAADVQAGAGEGTGLQALAWLKAQVAGRPTTEQAGDSVGAVTSRIAARISEGKLTEALDEAEALPDHAQTGLGGWLDQLRARVAADSALADWRTQIGAGG